MTVGRSSYIVSYCLHAGPKPSTPPGAAVTAFHAAPEAAASMLPARVEMLRRLVERKGLTFDPSRLKLLVDMRPVALPA